MEFDEHHLSEVQNMASEEKLDEVLQSMKKSKVALIGMGKVWEAGGVGLQPQALVTVGDLLQEEKGPLPSVIWPALSSPASCWVCSFSDVVGMGGGLVLAGKIHTPMEYKGELASYDMRLRYVSAAFGGAP